jgi:glycosyltransferase involved in cell wall biosynthesis
MNTEAKSSTPTREVAPAPGQARAVSKPSYAPWVLVAGGFHRNGGMDKANLALAEYLIDRGTPVHVVSYSVDSQFASNPAVTVHKVHQPAGSVLLGKPLLNARGRKVARALTAQNPDTMILVNGDNCLWPGINWIHYVHHAWDPKSDGGPAWFRVKQKLARTMARRGEMSAARTSRLFISNSERTTRDLIEKLGISPSLVHTVYLGAETDWGEVTPAERAASRAALGLDPERPLAVFVGSLALDNRKGFDTLFDAWKALCRSSDWDVDLLVFGGGNGVAFYSAQARQAGLEQRVRIQGFSEHVREILAAADLLVSPVRYEPYGLNVQEAICRGIPSIVSACAGVAEKYGPEVSPLLLSDPDDVKELTEILQVWRSNRESFQERFREFGAELRAYGWQDMARRIVEIAEAGSR